MNKNQITNASSLTTYYSKDTHQNIYCFAFVECSFLPLLVFFTNSICRRVMCRWRHRRTDVKNGETLFFCTYLTQAQSFAGEERTPAFRFAPGLKSIVVLCIIDKFSINLILTGHSPPSILDLSDPATTLKLVRD